MRVQKSGIRLLVLFTCLIAAQVLWQQEIEAAAVTDPDGNGAVQATDAMDDASCLNCHDDSEVLTITNEDGEIRPILSIPKIKYLRSVHGDMACVDCHKEIASSRPPHLKSIIPKPNCVSCHETLWETAENLDLGRQKARLGIVVENIEAYKNSFHARGSSNNRFGVKAYCEDCHGTHQFNIPPQGTARRTSWHLTVPQVCGAECHEDSLEEYLTSVDGVERKTIPRRLSAWTVIVPTASAKPHGIPSSYRLPNYVEIATKRSSLRTGTPITVRSTRWDILLLPNVSTVTTIMKSKGSTIQSRWSTWTTAWKPARNATMVRKFQKLAKDC